MRADILLNKLCLVKTRSIAKKGFDGGAIKVNGKTAKASKEVQPGDILEIQFLNKILEVEIVDLPAGNVSKKQAQEYYRVISDRIIEEE